MTPPLRFAAYADVASAIAGNVLELAAATAGTRSLSAPIPGRAVTAPTPPLPRSWRRLLAMAAAALAPVAVLHEYIFERVLFLQLAAADALRDDGSAGGGGGGGGSGASYPLFAPAGAALFGAQPYAAAVASAQSVVLLSVAVWLVLLSSLFLSRAKFWRDVDPLRSGAWRAGAALALTLQLAHSHALTASAGAASLFATTSYDVWLALALGQLACLLVAVAVKRRDARRYCNEQKYLKALFDVRLGMYSPR